ncbi:hypothetical protein CBR_g18561 [Chara braunii]|uniref:RCC1-like domain-containing protein n=1 Tax=Chara braunii TaxID=69332 RepID=A0A388JTD4_CHABU|nr:hypothetical protein CBR_g18561 [Chara braunii]|eukprot:GBG60962.1 hypothetical protein CBR_g18561 [Chara braunii]
MADGGDQEGCGVGVHASDEDGREVEGGELLFCGSTDAGLWMKKCESLGEDRATGFPFILGPARLAGMKGIKVVHVAAGCASSHCVAADAGGRCFAWGHNDNGQLGLGDVSPRDVPVQVSSLSMVRVIKAAVGRHHTVVVSADGSSYSFGQNKFGQLGTGSAGGQMETKPVKSRVQAAFDVACGAEFTLWLTNVGLLSAGLSQYGQLGDGKDREDSDNACGAVSLICEPQPMPSVISSFVGKRITKAACGINHSVAVDSEGYVYTWGFGGDGRLGHGEQKDEWAPRMLDAFTGANRVPSNALLGAGGAFSVVSAAGGELYIWGRVKTEAGDSVLFHPNRVLVNGWTIHSLGCGSTTTLAAAESCCISWGAGHCGELGYGANEPRSSAVPRKIESLEGLHIHRVAAGQSHSLFIVDVEGDAREKLEKLPVLESKVTKDCLQGLPEVIEEYLENGFTRSTAFNRRGTLLAAGRQDGTIAIWNFDTRAVMKELSSESSSSPIISVSWSKRGWKLLSASIDKRILLWDVLTGNVEASVEFDRMVLTARMHPSINNLCLVCFVYGAPLLVDIGSGEKLPVPVYSPPPYHRGIGSPLDRGVTSVRRGGSCGFTPAPPSSNGEGGIDMPSTACFNKRGDVVYVGNSRGQLLIVEMETCHVLDVIQVTSGTPIRQLAFSRSGKYLLTNSNDRVLRVFENLLPKEGAAEAAKKIMEGRRLVSADEQGGAMTSSHDWNSMQGSGRGGGSVIGTPCEELIGGGSKRRCSELLVFVRGYQDAVNRYQWKAACFSGNEEYIIAASSQKTEHKAYIWHRKEGTLKSTLEGPKEGVVDLVCHPVRLIIASVASSGLVYIWAQEYTEKWAAFAPDFEELSMNEEYLEREDEFDKPLPDSMGVSGNEVEQDEDEDVDVMTVERLSVYSDSDDSRDCLYYLPTVPIPDRPPDEVQAQSGRRKDLAQSHDGSAAAEGEGEANHAEDGDNEDAAAEKGGSDEQSAPRSANGKGGELNRAAGESIQEDVVQIGPNGRPVRKRKLTERSVQVQELLEKRRSLGKSKKKPGGSAGKTDVKTPSVKGEATTSPIAAAAGQPPTVASCGEPCSKVGSPRTVLAREACTSEKALSEAVGTLRRGQGGGDSGTSLFWVGGDAVRSQKLVGSEGEEAAQKAGEGDRARKARTPSSGKGWRNSAMGHPVSSGMFHAQEPQLGSLPETSTGAVASTVINDKDPLLGTRKKKPGSSRVAPGTLGTEGRDWNAAGSGVTVIEQTTRTAGNDRVLDNGNPRKGPSRKMGVTGVSGRSAGEAKKTGSTRKKADISQVHHAGLEGQPVGADPGHMLQQSVGKAESRMSVKRPVWRVEAVPGTPNRTKMRGDELTPTRVVGRGPRLGTAAVRPAVGQTWRVGTTDTAAVRGEPSSKATQSIKCSGMEQKKGGMKGMMSAKSLGARPAMLRKGCQPVGDSGVPKGIVIRAESRRGKAEAVGPSQPEKGRAALGKGKKGIVNERNNARVKVSQPRKKVAPSGECCGLESADLLMPGRSPVGTEGPAEATFGRPMFHVVKPPTKQPREKECVRFYSMTTSPSDRSKAEVSGTSTLVEVGPMLRRVLPGECPNWRDEESVTNPPLTTGMTRVGVVRSCGGPIQERRVGVIMRDFRMDAERRIGLAPGVQACRSQINGKWGVLYHWPRAQLSRPNTDKESEAEMMWHGKQDGYHSVLENMNQRGSSRPDPWGQEVRSVHVQCPWMTQQRKEWMHCQEGILKENGATDPIRECSSGKRSAERRCFPERLPRKRAKGSLPAANPRGDDI